MSASAADPPPPADLFGREGLGREWLAAGTAGLACLPPYLVWRGTPSLGEVLLALSLAAPVLAAFVAERSGSRDAGCAVSAAGTAGVAAMLACTSPAGVWAAVPLLLADAAGSWLRGRPTGALAAAFASSAVFGGVASLAALLPAALAPTPLLPLAAVLVAGLRALSMVRLAIRTDRARADDAGANRQKESGGPETAHDRSGGVVHPSAPDAAGGLSSHRWSAFAGSLRLDAPPVSAGRPQVVTALPPLRDHGKASSAAEPGRRGSDIRPPPGARATGASALAGIGAARPAAPSSEWGGGAAQLTKPSQAASAASEPCLLAQARPPAIEGGPRRVSAIRTRLSA